MISYYYEHLYSFDCLRIIHVFQDIQSMGDASKIFDDKKVPADIYINILM